MNDPCFLDQAPDVPELTDYDRGHMQTYLRLLDAAEEEADWSEVVRIVFGLDPRADPARARTMHDSHLARARWISARGYQCLIWKK
ncbi:DUF2285 domain-containing protein [Brevundimonas diminuta]|uniref:DUF2285 domain-containing protein n=2 Tax=Brevundimonas diminuta TaxID=293 RepID=A0A410NXL8_BREDI|nr:DUF2285 domain-containing protein [Brevundimonas diminuta]MBD3573035.1 DUF2285 domain-containing protein [Brevundimonas diminuta]QAT14630.1 DUF2285 domain-containing protein [Brevundimonas diminuta]QQB87990.1 DUF2285 domain-containing protein [Brevundimonas diminuta]GEC00345.1 hypothetical protein BDI01nite_14090 [Brevundimonas diminuta]